MQHKCSINKGFSLVFRIESQASYAVHEIIQKVVVFFNLPVLDFSYGICV